MLVAVRKNLCSKFIPCEITLFNQVFVLLRFRDISYVIGGCYIPPSSDRIFYESHCTSVELVMSLHPDAHLILCGDYNLPEAEWSNVDNGLRVECPNGSSAVTLVDSFTFLDLLQMNYVRNTRGRLLDLVFAHVGDVSVSCSVDPLLPANVNHTPLDIMLTSADCDSMNYEEYFYDFKNADYLAINNFIACYNWESVFSEDLDYSLECLYNVLYTAIVYFVPVKKFKRSSFPVWFTAELRQLTIEKKKIHKRFKSFGRQNDYLLFSQLRDSCKELSRRCYSSYISNVEKDVNLNPKRFWSYVNNLKKSYDLPGNMCYGNLNSTNLTDTVNMFSDFFSSTYRNDSVVDLPSFQCNKAAELDNFTIRASEIVERIGALPLKLSHGPDGIPSYFLFNCRFTLATPLKVIFNLSLSSGIFPDIWKYSFLKPIHKSGSRENVENYRAICLQSEIPKLLDYFVSRHLTEQYKQLFVKEQHGFLHGKSTSTNLALYSSTIVAALEDRLQVDSVYTDFSKAFDRVNHKILLAKLESMGLGGSLLMWVGSYLSGRRQGVRVGSSVSADIVVTSGVPQGSHCGPVLFNLFVNDIPGYVKHSKVLMFADDLKLFKVIENEGDSLLLQCDLDCLAEWCSKNDLALNLEKCCCITFARITAPIMSTYSINMVPVKRVGMVRDLGVTFDSEFTFSTHIDQIVAKAYRVLGFVNRSSRTFSVNTLRVLYCSIVRSVLEYSAIIWSPYYHVHIDRIEGVQRKFLRICAFRLGLQRSDCSCQDVGDYLSLQSLQSRRMAADLCFLRNLLSGEIDCSTLLDMITLNTCGRARNSELFRVPFHPTNYGYNSLMTRIVRLANRFSGSIDIFSDSTYAVKRKLAVLLCTGE